MALKEKVHELQSTVQTLKDAVKKSESDYGKKISQYTKEIQHYKNINNVEKEEKVKVQQTLAQVTLELKEKNDETVALTKSQYELQSNMHKLKQHEIEYNNKIDEYAKQIEHYLSLSEAEKVNTVKIQDDLVQISAELQEKRKEALAFKESQHELQSLRQSKSEYDRMIARYTKEIQYYKDKYDAEKFNSVKVQEKSAQVSAELQDKSKETLSLKEKHHELQIIIQNLEDDLRQSKTEHEKNIIEYSKQIEHLKSLNETEKENNFKLQDNLAKVSAEVQEKTKETLALQESQLELQSAIQELKGNVRQSKIDYDNKIVECTKEIEHYKNLSDVEKDNAAKAKADKAQLSAELQEKTKEILALEESHHELQHALRQSKSEHDKMITQYTEEIQHYKSINNHGKINSVEVEEQLVQVSAELQEKTKETVALKESQHELQSIIQSLEDALKQSKTEHDQKIVEMEYSKNTCDAEKENTAKLQDKLVVVSAKLQEKTEELKESQHPLQDTLKDNVKAKVSDLEISLIRRNNLPCSYTGNILKYSSAIHCRAVNFQG